MCLPTAEWNHVVELQGRRTIRYWRGTLEHQVHTIKQFRAIAPVVAHPLCGDITERLHGFEQLC